MKLIHPTNKWKRKCFLRKLILHQSIGFEFHCTRLAFFSRSFFSSRDFLFIYYFPRFCSFACFALLVRFSQSFIVVRFMCTRFCISPYILFTQYARIGLRFTTPIDIRHSAYGNRNFSAIRLRNLIFNEAIKPM